MTAALQYLAGAVAPCPCDLWGDAAVIAQDDACSWQAALDGFPAWLASGDDFRDAF